MKLLLVEDDREISEMLQNFLQTENFDADTVFDGENACRSFEEIYYDLVILDLMLPGINGLEVIKRIRFFLMPANWQDKSFLSNT